MIIETKPGNVSGWSAKWATKPQGSPSSKWQRFGCDSPLSARRTGGDQSCRTASATPSALIGAFSSTSGRHHRRRSNEVPAPTRDEAARHFRAAREACRGQCAARQDGPGRAGCVTQRPRPAGAARWSPGRPCEGFQQFPRLPGKPCAGGVAMPYSPELQPTPPTGKPLNDDWAASMIEK